MHRARRPAEERPVMGMSAGQGRYAALVTMARIVWPPRLTFSFLPRLKPVADIADGVDERRVVRVGLDLGAQGGDAAVDAAGRHHDGAAPDHVQNVVAGECAALPGHQVLQQPELLRGQLDLFAPAEQLVRGQVQLIVAKSRNGRLLRLGFC